MQSCALAWACSPCSQIHGIRKTPGRGTETLSGRYAGARCQHEEGPDRLRIDAPERPAGRVVAVEGEREGGERERASTTSSTSLMTWTLASRRRGTRAPTREVASMTRAPHRQEACRGGEGHLRRGGVARLRLATRRRRRRAAAAARRGWPRTACRRRECPRTTRTTTSRHAIRVQPRAPPQGGAPRQVLARPRRGRAPSLWWSMSGPPLCYQGLQVMSLLHVKPLVKALLLLKVMEEGEALFLSSLSLLPRTPPTPPQTKPPRAGSA